MTPADNASRAPGDLTPGPIKESTVRKYFERGGKLKLQSDRSYWTNMMSLVLNLFLASVIVMLLPLKTVQTVVIHEGSVGQLNPGYNEVDNYMPDRNAIAYFLSAWVDNARDINASVINDRLTAAGAVAIGDAHDQLQELVKEDNPLGRLRQYPYLRRTYQRLSLNFVKNDTVVLRYSLTERTGPGSPPTVTVWVMTITFERIPPHTQEQVDTNPAGLYVTSFNNSQEVNNTQGTAQ
jgi:type IV secretion system protein TrbF